jgi:hypothetical protein
MAFSLDPDLYPRTSKYLKSLPSGLDAYPDCRTATDLYILLRQLAPEVFKEPTLPVELRMRLGEQWAPRQFLPASLAFTLVLALRDRHFKSDTSYKAALYEHGAAVFRQPLFRALMVIMSPSLMVMGASMRWKQWYENIPMTTKQLKKQEARLRLMYPPNLCPETWLVGIGATYCAAIDCAGGKETQCTITELQPTTAEFSLLWK